MAKKSMVMENPAALTAGLRALELAVSESTLRKATLAGARVFLAEEKIRVPVKTGKGRDNLIVAYDSERSLPGVSSSYIVTWTKEAYYLRFIEYGKSKVAAQPFKRPAYEAKKTEAAAAVDEVLNAAINGASGG
ncbi:HK97 gp10 family phage protein [Robbsia sp. Bb-Pol-6]|uniref:HK97 gp10 family phage protein n=1 Tax=Robbsia betulipollinis TaxID=2981849 RepID=A0ABT3ZGJ6_9BURK|nr:HK97-gp10 family putative phage morphogenesis protein [Robbsia betulipollinis]MCY0385659.1 HK97 gp10 family phage protein [Robbsia betulipollinis]